LRRQGIEERADDGRAGIDQQPLHEAGETHHWVFRIVDGADDDWASWYADWLVHLSELPDVPGRKPVRAEMIYLLVRLNKQYTAEQPAEPWEAYYALRIADHFAPARKADDIHHLAVGGDAQRLMRPEAAQPVGTPRPSVQAGI
jgi:hypothetical protein